MIKKLKFIIPLMIGIVLFASTSFAGLSRVKTWVSAEVLTHTDLNAEFSNIIDNFLTGLTPLTGNLDFNDKEALNLVLEKLAADGTGVEGQVIYNTTNDHLKLKNDSAWTFVLDVPTMGTSGQFLKTDGTDASWGLPADLAIASQAQGDILYFDGTNWVSLAAGTSGYYLKTQGAGANPVWVAVPGLTWKATNSSSLDLTGQTDVAYTDLDLTSVTSANAKAVILRVLFTNTTAGEYVQVLLRKNGETPDEAVMMSAPDALGGNTASLTTMAIVGCDGGQIIEYSIDTETSATCTLRLAVVGYWE